MKTLENILESMAEAYAKGGAEAAYQIAKDLNLPDSLCTECEAQTPTIASPTHCYLECETCGTEKHK